MRTELVLAVVLLMFEPLWAQDANGPDSRGVGFDKRILIASGRTASYTSRANGTRAEDGQLSGIAINLMIPTRQPSLKLGGEAEYLSGIQTYEGETVRGERVTGESIQRQWGLRAQATWLLDRSGVSYRPYLGIGYRNSSAEVKTTGGYPRVVDFFYVPIGLEVHAISKLAGWISSAEVAYVTNTRTRNYLSYIDQALPDVELKGGEGVGFRFSQSALFDVDPRFVLVAQVFWQYWRLPATETKYLAANLPMSRPETSSQQIGVSLGAAF